MASQLQALALTLLIEAPLLLYLTRAWPVGRWRRVACIFLPSMLTHPLAWHAIGNFGAHDYVEGWLLIETMVVVAEALMLYAIGRSTLRQAWASSLLANLSSSVLGGLVAGAGV